MNKSGIVKIAIFASGSGTNAENIANYFSNNLQIKVKLILSNKAEAFVIQRAKKLNIQSHVFSRKEFYETESILRLLKNEGITWIILAGFLWLVPDNLIDSFPNHIINIHPALLPKYGGKGMYGDRVHEAIIKNEDKESGITIHYVNKEYDQGNIIFQAICKVESTDTPKSLAEKVHRLEYENFPVVIEKLVMDELKMA